MLGDTKISNKQYISLAGTPTLHYYPDYTVLNIRSPENYFIHLFLNSTATDILEICNGEVTIETVINNFSMKYNAPLEKVTSSVWNVINQGLESNYITVSENSSKNHIIKTGSKEYYHPQNISVEITNKCNEKCSHCYGDFNNSNQTQWNLDDLKRVISELISKGTRAVTITGGEPFMHPKIKKFIEWILPQIEALGIISNGTLIPNSIYPVLKAHPYKIAFQVSLNGNREYHDFFTGLPGSFDKVLNNIPYLVDTGLRLRISMNINEDNLKYIQTVAEIANNLNAFVFSLSPSHNIGREFERRSKSNYFEGKSTDSSLDMMEEFVREVNIAKDKYPRIFKFHDDFKSIMAVGKSDPVTDITQFPSTFSCGAGLKSVHIDARGNVHVCPISQACNFPVLGNVIEESIDNVMKSTTARKIKNIYAPASKYCEECNNFIFCGGCMVRGYSKYLDIQNNCKWGRSIFNN